ncbi:HD domain-containing phosphohydrolase [Cohnella sp. GCM10020058]|uniref:HD domain-containing phosphohydrolase n=1 Tax=Cohnella sp. GCM10020058 TaxID=3317330 RepID=UPI00362B9C5A
MEQSPYRSLVIRLVRNYIIGSVVAVLGVGGAILSGSLSLPRVELLHLQAILLISLLTMFVAEYFAFRRHIAPIRELFRSERPALAQIEAAYLRAHRLPSLAVTRTLGPHLLGLSLPASALALLAIRLGWAKLPYYYIGLAAAGAVLVACMHALIEFFLTAQSIRPLLAHLRAAGRRMYGADISLSGRVLVSIQRKFQLSAFLIGTFPVILFSLATQIRLNGWSQDLGYDYWRWAGLILVTGVGFSSLGAWLLGRDVQQPIRELYEAMSEVQAGRLHTSASDLYSDEFARLTAGFNGMVEGLRSRERMNAQLLQSYYATLAAALDARDAYTAGHSQRVAEYSSVIGRAAGLSADELDVLRKSALLHDIGKIGVRDSVLLKEGKLTDEEFEQIKQHPVLGENILLQVEPREAMAPLLPGVRSHHERYDGRGYPDGLSGEGIPAAGRIIAVADAFDAMTSDRPYRKGMPFGKAFAILEEGGGTQWDPVYVELFVSRMRGS